MVLFCTPYVFPIDFGKFPRNLFKKERLYGGKNLYIIINMEILSLILALMSEDICCYYDN